MVVDRRKAVRLAVERLGSASELARMSGVSSMTIGRFLSGKTKYISEPNWQKLEPHVDAFTVRNEKKPDASPDPVNINMDGKSMTFPLGSGNDVHIHIHGHTINLHIHKNGIEIESDEG
jgi:transcriptional regulator with XRE-family HTH domain